MNYGWTEFVKSRSDEIARLTKEAEAEIGPATPDESMDPPPEVPSDAPALPGMAAALKRLLSSMRTVCGMGSV